MSKTKTSVYVIEKDDTKIDFWKEYNKGNFERIKERAAERGNCWSLGGFEKSFNKDPEYSKYNHIYIEI